MLRILYVSVGYKPAYRIGGPVLSVSAAAEALVRKGHRVTVVTTNANLDEDLDVPVDQPVLVDGVEVLYFRREEFLRRWLPFVPYLSRSAGFLYAPHMAPYLDRLAPAADLIHTHLPYAYPTYVGARAARRFRKPLFYHQRGNFDPARLKFRAVKKWLYIWAVERPIMRSATTLVALTEAEVRSYRALGITTPCRVVPNGIDVAGYRLRPGSDIGARWHVRDDALVILFLGRLHPIKGAHRVIEAFLRLQTVNPRAILVMTGPDEWGLESAFRETIRQAGLAGRVVFPGMVAGDDKLDWLARADLFCLPSDAEGFSMAVLEALASATPVLLSPGCHFPEVETVGAGRVVAPTPEALAAALADMLALPERLKEMGRRGRQLVAEKYSWDTVADQLIDAYGEGIERHRHDAQRLSGRVA